MSDERDVFRALAHPIRRRVVVALADKPRGFDELKRLARRSDATVAAHLRILRQAGLVTASRQGQRTQYQARLEPIGRVTKWLNAVSDTAGDANHHAAA